MKWLLEVPPPSNNALGPIGRGHIHHRFFKEFKAPFVFPDHDVVTLDQYVKTVHPCFYFLERPPLLTCTLGQAYCLLSHMAQQKMSPVSICGEHVMFTQSDMDNSNFGVDEHGTTVLMDFSKIGLLPETFVAFTLSSDDKLDPITASLGLSDNSNLTSMAAITQCLAMVSNPK